MTTKEKLQSYIEQAELILKKETQTPKQGLVIPPYIHGPLYDKFMSDIVIFNERHMKNHPLYKEIKDTLFFSKGGKRGSISRFKELLGHLKAIEGDDEFFEEFEPVQNEKNFEGEKMSTVFISYSWDDDSHKEWVLTLAKKLQEDNIVIKLDQLDLKLGDELTEYMETSIRDSDKVLIICPPRL